MRLLITGATGKVGQEFLARFLAADTFQDWQVVALCHNRQLEPHPRVECVTGSLSDPDFIGTAMKDVTHVLHMAAVKESPELAIDVSVKGMFWLLEHFRNSDTSEQFVLIGGDCSVGHIFHQYEGPITESAPRRAYPGCYALTKVLEEEMLNQFQIQYGINGCCLRAPWIMEKDDFKHVLKFDGTQFGGPAWNEYMPQAQADKYAAEGVVPMMLDVDETPLLRNFVHVSDLVEAILKALDNPAASQQLFNIAMTDPVNYADVAKYLKDTQGLASVPVSTPHFSNKLDNSKARQLLDWSPQFDLPRLIDEAWAYQRAENDPRVVWYPG